MVFHHAVHARSCCSELGGVCLVRDTNVARQEIHLRFSNCEHIFSILGNFFCTCYETNHFCVNLHGRKYSRIHNFVLQWTGLFARAHDDTHKKYWFEGSLEGQYLRIAALGVEVITVLAAFVVSGQKIEDAVSSVVVEL